MLGKENTVPDAGVSQSRNVSPTCVEPMIQQNFKDNRRKDLSLESHIVRSRLLYSSYSRDS